jgi:hypothetical protein
MPTCCKGKLTKPRIHNVGKDREIHNVGKDGSWSGFCGSALLTGYTTKKEIMRALRQERDQQRVYACGHVIRIGSYSEWHPKRPEYDYNSVPY